MAATKNQSFATNNLAGTTATYNVTTNFTAGRSGIVLLSYYQSGGGGSIAVSIGGDVATLAAEGGGIPNSDRRYAQVWYVRTLTGGSTAVALTGLLVGDGVAVTVIELDDGMPVSPVDVTSTSTTAVVSPLTRTTAATTQDNTFVVVVASSDGFAATGVAAPTSGYTLGQVHDPAPSTGCAASSTGYKYATSIGTQAATWTFTANTFVGAVVTFKINAASLALMGQACL